MNKKIIRSIVSIACGLGIVGSIPFVSTSCGSSQEDVVPSNALPYEVYEIQNNILLGFKEGIDFSQYEDEYDTIQIPSNVTKIEREAFCKNLTTTIPDFITKLTFAEGSSCSLINDETFKNCTSLTSITFPESLLIIGTWSFQGCSSLTSINFSNKSNLTNISAYAFENCSLLTSVSLPNGLTTLDYSVFNGCSSLTSISFPSSLEKIEDKVFNNCPNLSSITWDAWNGNTDFQNTSFAGVYQDGGTVTVNNPSGYDSIKLLNALIDSAGLPLDWGLTLPSNVYKINEDNTLEGFTEEFLANPDAYSDYRIMEIPARVMMINRTAFFVTGGTLIPSYIKKLTFEKESKLTTILGGAFRGDYKSPLKSVDLINCTNLETIFQDAFAFCPSLSSVRLPGNINQFDIQVFYYCSSLKSIVWNAISANPEMGQNCFLNVASSGVVKITNPVQGYTASDLLTFLKTKGLPANWTAE